MTPVGPGVSVDKTVGCGAALDGATSELVAAALGGATGTFVGMAVEGSTGTFDAVALGGATGTSIAVAVGRATSALVGVALGGATNKLVAVTLGGATGTSVAVALGGATGTFVAVALGGATGTFVAVTLGGATGTFVGDGGGATGAFVAVGGATGTLVAVAGGATGTIVTVGGAQVAVTARKPVVATWPWPSSAVTVTFWFSLIQYCIPNVKLPLVSAGAANGPILSPWSDVSVTLTEPFGLYPVPEIENSLPGGDVGKTEHAGRLVLIEAASAASGAISKATTTESTASTLRTPVEECGTLCRTLAPLWFSTTSSSPLLGFQALRAGRRACEEND